MFRDKTQQTRNFPCLTCERSERAQCVPSTRGLATEKAKSTLGPLITTPIVSCSQTRPVFRDADRSRPPGLGSALAGVWD